MAYWDCLGMAIYGWYPGTVINMRVQEQALFIAYNEKMHTDRKWQHLLKLKNPFLEFKEG